VTASQETGAAARRPACRAPGRRSAQCSNMFTTGRIGSST
jgi:hypothetical protein